jgi:hypothetical protein
MSIETRRDVSYRVTINLTKEEQFEADAGFRSDQPVIVDTLSWTATHFGMMEPEKYKMLTSDSQVRFRGTKIKKDGTPGLRRGDGRMKVEDLPGDLGQRMIAKFEEIYKP